VEVFPLPDGIRGEKDVSVVMRDDIRIYTNVFRPAKDGRLPVIMSFSPYGKDIDPAKHARETEKQRESIGLSFVRAQMALHPWPEEMGRLL
jgi:predicted acyl esterase